MGGLGSGRPARYVTFGHAHALPVREIVRRAGPELAGRAGMEVRVAGQPLWLSSHPQPFGGVRWWWLCPRCCRRRATLYQLGGSPWACRCCLPLTYASRREYEWHRAERRLRTLAVRLGIPPDAAHEWDSPECPDKPNGMHWRTYERLADEWATVWERGNAAAWAMVLHLMGHGPGDE
jgi:hypothetical protein